MKKRHTLVIAILVIAISCTGCSPRVKAGMSILGAACAVANGDFTAASKATKAFAILTAKDALFDTANAIKKEIKKPKIIKVEK